MMPAIYYSYIYLFIVTLVTFSLVQYRKDLSQRERLGGSVFLCLFLCLFIGFRPHSAVFGDTINYAKWWRKATWNGWDWVTENVLFDNLYGAMESVFPDATELFVLISCLYFIGILVACRKVFPSNTLIAFVVYLGAFSTFSYSVNGIKAGAAASFFLVALAYHEKRMVSLLFLLVSWGFHHSMQLPVAAYVVTLFFKNKKWYFYGWCFCFLMAAAHVTTFQTLFAGYSDSIGARYLVGGANETVLRAKVGFRLDFILYSAMPIVIAYYAKFKYDFSDRFYDRLLSMYLTCNGVWMLCMYAEFTNRIAYLSWFMYPILLIYPCYAIEDEQHPLVRIRKKVIYGHLLFTLFMFMIGKF